MKKLPVYVSRAVLMQRLSDLARRGYHHHISGNVPLEKVPRVAAKLADAYSTELPPHTQSRRRAKGLAVYRILWLSEHGPDTRPESLRYWIVSTDGERSGEAAKDNWQDARQRKQRITLTFSGYQLEMVRHARAGKGEAAWTWRIEARAFKRQMQRLCLIARRRGDLRRELFLLAKLPGFAGIREQKGALYRAIERDWKLVHRDSRAPDLGLPRVIPWLRRLPNLTVPLDELGRRQRASRQKKPRQKGLREQAGRKASLEHEVILTSSNSAVT